MWFFNSPVRKQQVSLNKMRGNIWLGSQRGWSTLPCPGFAVSCLCLLSAGCQPVMLCLSWAYLKGARSAACSFKRENVKTANGSWVLESSLLGLLALIALLQAGPP